MIDAKTRALLGDKEAQTYFCDKGELLPCHCGRKVDFDTIYMSGNPGVCCILKCGCGIALPVFAQNENDAVIQLIRIWNARAPILTLGQIEKLDKMISE